MLKCVGITVPRCVKSPTQKDNIDYETETEVNSFGSLCQDQDISVKVLRENGRIFLRVY